MSHPNLTERQREIFQFISRHLGIYGSPPTVRDIGSEFGIRSPNGVMCHIRALESKGLITQHTKGRMCYVPVVKAGHCPCCGQALPVEAVPQNWDLRRQIESKALSDGPPNPIAAAGMYGSNDDDEDIEDVEEPSDTEPAPPFRAEDHF